MIELHFKQPRPAGLQFTTVGEFVPCERSSVEDGLKVTEMPQPSHHRFTNRDRKPAMTVFFVSPASSSSALLLVSCDSHLQSSCFSGQVRSPSLFLSLIEVFEPCGLGEARLFREFGRGPWPFSAW